MRLSKKYIAFALVLALGLFWKLNNWSDKYAQVETFRGASLQAEVFYPLMSKNLNDTGKVSLYINDVQVENNDAGIILSNTLEPVASLSFIRDVLGGSAHRVDYSLALLQISDDLYEFFLDNMTALKNGDDVSMAVAPTEYLGEFYIGLQQLCDFFDYEYYYNPQDFSIHLTFGETAILPEKYDLREFNKVSSIRDQGSNSTCWACASIEAMESSLLPYRELELSVDSMIEENSFDLKPEDGGDYTMALAYLTSWQGPVLEKNKEASVHLQEAHFYTAKDVEKIKTAVFRYGGVSTSIYANVATSNLNKSNYYNKLTNSYCYMGGNDPNHDVVIIGWDDNYAAENFAGKIPGNGAFICQNSWGNDFGDDGVFYISYYDANIGKQAVSYVRIEDKTNYDNIYQSDLCGWVGQVGYNKEWAHGANVFTAKGNELIEAAGFYALGENSTYQLYFVSDYDNTGSLGNRTLVSQGKLKAAGYYTVVFSEAMPVEEGQEFAIILSISTPDTARPLAIEYASDKMSHNVDITDGKGFISNNGLDWESVENVANANLCLKAYSKNYFESIEE